MEKVFSPFDQRVLNEIKFCDFNLIDKKLDEACKAQVLWMHSSKTDRIKVIKKFCENLINDKDDIGKDISNYIGRPIQFSPKEVVTGVDRIKEMLNVFEQFSFNEKLDEQREIFHLPLGNILVFGAWNYPILTTVNSIVPAILAGNSVCFRPSSQAYFIADVFKSAFDRAGLPKGVFQVTTFSHDDTQNVVKSDKIDRIVYTGSTKGGRKIHQWAGGNLIPLTMELGGKDAAYIRSDAEIHSAVINVADGAFFNTGQSCCGVERVYAHQSVYKKVLTLLVKEAKKLVIGNPLNEDTNLGPLAKKSAVKHLIEQVERAKLEGAKTHLDELGQLNPTGQFVRPEIMTNVKNHFEIQQEETFGPFVTLTSVDDDDEAIKLINDSRYGLSCSIWSKDEEIAVNLAKRVEVGAILINRCDYVDPKLPWRGEKDTGLGVALGPNCFDSFIKARGICRS